MKQEDKELLLRDLSARLIYKPKIKVSSLWNKNKEVEEDIVDTVYCVMPDGYVNTETIDSDISLDDIVLYLRPISSMTEEEKTELLEVIVGKDGVKCFQVLSDGRIDNIYDTVWVDFNKDSTTSYIDWLNKKMFDYRGLIEKGLALEAPEGMYK